MESKRYPQRKSPRLKAYDYKTPNYYFVTICADQKKKLFGEPMKTNEFGKIAEEAFLQIPNHYPQVEVIKYVVMPNHVHAIFHLSNEKTALGTVVGSYKAYVTKLIRQSMPNIIVWQTSFHDHVIRSQAEFEKIWSYIDTNPMRWQDDCYFEDAQGIVTNLP